MTYERQESAYDPIGNAEQEAERADYAGLHGEELAGLSAHNAAIFAQAGKEWRDVERIQAERDEAVGRGGLPAIGNHRTISAEWMGAPSSQGLSSRSHWPMLAALDAEAILHDTFEAMRPSLGSFGYCKPPSPHGTTPYLRSVMISEMRHEFMRFGSSRIQISRITISREVVR